MELADAFRIGEKICGQIRCLIFMSDKYHNMSKFLGNKRLQAINHVYFLLGMGYSFHYL
jgi:hypothetical protein